jgi:hypothetical protein
MHESVAADADPVLAWWPKGGKLRFIHPDEWPSAAVAA